MADPLNISSAVIPKETTMPPKVPLPQDNVNLVNPERVVKPTKDAQIENQNRHNEEHNIRSNMSRAVFEPVLRGAGEAAQMLQKLIVMVESSAQVSPQSEGWQNALEMLYLDPQQLLAALLAQDDASSLFKGEFFDILRNAVTENPENSQLKDTIVQILKYFSGNVNTDSSKNTILQNCYNLTDYMFTEDRVNFIEYLQKLEGMLGLSDQPIPTMNENDPQTVFQQQAAALKNNLVPLLGEIVRQYNQEEGLRNAVMSIINNVVRFDKGDKTMLLEAIYKFAQQLGQTKALPENFTERLVGMMEEALIDARNVKDPVTGGMANLLEASLNGAQSASELKMAESLMFNLIHHQNPIMNVLHFILPLKMDDSYSFAELYVDPDSNERKGESREKASKLFLCIDSQEHGLFELSFWVHGKDIELSMSCPGALVNELGGIKKELSQIASQNGYSLNKYEVGELTRPKNIVQVFPKLITRRVGIDVKI